MRKKVIVVTAALMVAFVTWGCSRSVDPTQDSRNRLGKINPPIRGSLGPAPFPDDGVSNGLIVTNYYAAASEWGNTQGQTVVTFPNPFAPEVAACSVVVALNNSTTLNLWMKRVRGPGEQRGVEGMHEGVTGVQLPGTSAVVRNYGTFRSEPGYLIVAWDGKDDYGNDLPPGFYRVFATDSGNRERAWGDVLLLRKPTDRPEGIKANPWSGGWSEGE